jgi:carbamoyl-phosphate synthase large subunit
MNIQFAIKKEMRNAECGMRNDNLSGNSEFRIPNSEFDNGRPVVYILEVNPRASRTVPFVSKATGAAVAKIAAKVMAGVSLEEQGFLREPIPAHVSIKESVFPFNKFAGVDIVLGPEMRSTGEVMGISERFSIAFAKSQLAAGVLLPERGRIFVSVADRTKPQIIDVARRLARLGYQLFSTAGTARVLEEAGIPVERVRKLQEGHPNVLDHLIDQRVQLVINTPSGKGARTDEGRIRAAAVLHRVPCITTLQAAQAAVKAMEALRYEELNVQSLQDRFRKTASVEA